MSKYEDENWVNLLILRIHSFKVGRLAEEEPTLKYAFAGRNKEKLEQTLETARTNTGLELAKAELIVVDVNDEESLKEMAARSKVVINCVGPVSIEELCYLDLAFM